MKLKVWSEARFASSPDGTVWTPAGNDYAFWTRYLDAFDEVAVVARVRQISEIDSRWARVDGRHVRVDPLPHYQGGKELLLRYPLVRSDSIAAAQEANYAHLFRVPSVVATPAIRYLQRVGRPYALEVVGDPAQVFAETGANPIARLVLGRLMPHALRQQCSRGAAVSYVTERTLQAIYPPGSGAVTTHFSSVRLTDESFASGGRRKSPSPHGCRLSTIATMDQPYKGVDTLIDAVALLKARSMDCSLVIVGDGKLRPSYEAHARRSDVADRVTFLGALARPSSVREVLDRSDMFVLASRTEGLPRSLIEAMARGLPCIGTRVGGIPELLEDTQLLPPDNPGALAQAIEVRGRNPDLLATESARNLAVARRYAHDVLSKRRRLFYKEFAGIASWPA